MADRIFAGILFMVALGYSFIAFTLIKAPFQYDPLGPESWPRLLGIVAMICTGYLIWRPDVARLEVTIATLGRLAILVVMLFAYAWAFQPLGFILATITFCTALSLFLGATPGRGVAFGLTAGIVGYAVCTVLLDLNLPAGILKPFL
jgi:putative tricarboxylic transport membrane protein